MKLSYLIFLALSTASTAIFNFLCQIYIAKSTNPEIYGQYSAYLTFILVTLPLLTVGIGNYLIKYFSEDKGRVVVNINIIALFFLSSTIGLIFFNILLNIYFHQLGSFVVFLLSFGILGFAIHEFYLSYLVGCEKKNKIIFWQPSLHFFRLLILWLFIFLFEKLDIYHVALMSFFISLFFLIVFYLLIKVDFNFDFKKFSFKKVFSILKSSIWFGLVGFLYILYSQINILYIDRFVGSVDAGYFNIGYTFLLMSLILPSTFYSKYLLPKLHRMYSENIVQLKKIYAKGVLITFFIGVVVALMLNIMSEFIIINLYGYSYRESIVYFKYIAFSIPFFYLSIHIGIFSYLGDFQKYKVYSLFFVTIFSLLVNYILVLIYGVMGAILGLNIVIIFLSIVYAILNKFFIFNKFGEFKNEEN